MFLVPSYRPELYGCQLVWKDDHTLLLGWADRIKVCVVKEQRRADAHDMPRRFVEIGKIFLNLFLKIKKKSISDLEWKWMLNVLINN